MKEMNNEMRYDVNMTPFYSLMFFGGLNVGLASAMSGSFTHAIIATLVAAVLYNIWTKAGNDIENRATHQLMDLAVESEENHIKKAYTVQSLLSNFDGSEKEIGIGLTYLFSLDLIDIKDMNGNNVRVVRTSPFNVKFYRQVDEERLGENDLQFVFINDSTKFFYDGRQAGRHASYQETYAGNQ